MTDDLLTVDSASVQFATNGGRVHAVSQVSFNIRRGEFLGLVGETGCGKTTLGLAILGLLPSNATVAGTIRFQGKPIGTNAEADMRTVRGNQVGYIPQDPLVSLDPTFSVGSQITEAIRAHRNLSRRSARRETESLLTRVGLGHQHGIYRQPPHVLSGGMRQRVAIAIAIANSPALIVADEPTTALDVTIQAQILSLLIALTREAGTSVLLVTHDLAVVSEVCDRVAVLYAGHLVEIGPVDKVLMQPRHPYTRALLKSSPARDWTRRELETIPGELPSLLNPSRGCPFAARCSFRIDRCEVNPPLTSFADGSSAACWIAQASGERDTDQASNCGRSSASC